MIVISINEAKLTDGSPVYDVRMYDDITCASVTFDAITMTDAIKLAAALDTAIGTYTNEDCKIV